MCLLTSQFTVVLNAHNWIYNVSLTITPNIRIESGKPDSTVAQVTPLPSFRLSPSVALRTRGEKYIKQNILKQINDNGIDFVCAHRNLHYGWERVCVSETSFLYIIVISYPFPINLFTFYTLYIKHTHTDTDTQCKIVVCQNVYCNCCTNVTTLGLPPLSTFSRWAFVVVFFIIFVLIWHDIWFHQHCTEQHMF